MIYRTYFKLTESVNDFNAARDFLTEDDMTVYLKDDIRCKCPDKIISIKWYLTDENSGHIDLETNAELTNEELDQISDWICGQNSDGLGESFEQQPFANYEDKGLEYGDDDEDDWDNVWVMASFDWQTNNYKLELVSTN